MLVSERERGRERGREGGREGGRERGREGGREGEREGERRDEERQNFGDSYRSRVDYTIGTFHCLSCSRDNCSNTRRQDDVQGAESPSSGDDPSLQLHLCHVTYY